MSSQGTISWLVLLHSFFFQEKKKKISSDLVSYIIWLIYLSAFDSFAKKNCRCQEKKDIDGACVLKYVAVCAWVCASVCMWNKSIRRSRITNRPKVPATLKEVIVLQDVINFVWNSSVSHSIWGIELTTSRSLKQHRSGRGAMNRSTWTAAEHHNPVLCWWMTSVSVTLSYSCENENMKYVSSLTVMKEDSAS